MKKLLPIFLFFGLLTHTVFAQCILPEIKGPTTGCTDRVATYTVVPTAGATNFEWKITGTNSFTKNSATEYALVFENNNISIEVTALNGTCAGTKNTLSVNVSATPNKPSISQTGNELNAGVAATGGYQWYSGSTKIDGATSITYTPTTNGSYLVQATSAGGCSSFSAPFNFFKTAIKEDAIFAGFTFYPNPVVDKLYVDFNSRYEVSLLNLTGQEVLQQTDLQGKQELDLSALKRGVYLLRISSDGKTAVRKLLLK
ncbi:MAG TPA: T9SS type A sorting domain-containing protein [Pelobium sp.]